MFHLPVFSPPGVDHDTRIYGVENALVCIDSFHAQGGHGLFVTTNDEQVLEVLSRFRGQVDRCFEVVRVTATDLQTAFRTDSARLHHAPSVKMLFSKFLPIFARLAPEMVHLDFDTLFVDRVVPGALFAGDVTLYDSNGYRDDFRWAPGPKDVDFFRLAGCQPPSWSWINSGVFAIRGGGLELCREEVSHFLEYLDRAIAIDVAAYPDEIIMNALAIRKRDRVKVLPDPAHNFLAYYLPREPAWQERCKILHFHSMKPQQYEWKNGRIEYQYPHNRLDHPAYRISDEFFLAVLVWCKRLHAVSARLGMDLPMTRRMPLEVVERVLARLSAKLDTRGCLERWTRPG